MVKAVKKTTVHGQIKSNPQVRLQWSPRNSLLPPGFKNFVNLAGGIFPVPVADFDADFGTENGWSPTGWVQDSWGFYHGFYPAKWDGFPVGLFGEAPRFDPRRRSWSSKTNPPKNLIPFSKIMVIQVKSRFTTVVTVVIKHRSLNGNSPSWDQRLFYQGWDPGAGIASPTGAGDW